MKYTGPVFSFLVCLAVLVGAAYFRQDAGWTIAVLMIGAVWATVRERMP